MPLIEDRRHQFLVMLGECCDAARLADLVVSVVLADGRVIVGRPELPAKGIAGDTIDHTGVTRRSVPSGLSLVALADVRRYSVSWPD